PRSARCQGRAQPPHHRSRSSCSSVRPTRRSRAASIGITAQFRQSLFFGQAHALLDSGSHWLNWFPFLEPRLDLKGRARLSSKKNLAASKEQNKSTRICVQ